MKRRKFIQHTAMAGALVTIDPRFLFASDQCAHLVVQLAQKE